MIYLAVVLVVVTAVLGWSLCVAAANGDRTP